MFSGYFSPEHDTLKDPCIINMLQMIWYRFFVAQFLFSFPEIYVIKDSRSTLLPG